VVGFSQKQLKKCTFETIISYGNIGKCCF